MFTFIIFIGLHSVSCLKTIEAIPMLRQRINNEFPKFEFNFIIFDLYLMQSFQVCVDTYLRPDFGGLGHM